MYCKRLSLQETGNSGMTHIASISCNDLTQATVNTAQSLNVLALPTGAIVSEVEARLIVPFENTADAAFNSVTLDVGDTGSATRWFTAQQVNKNGAFIAVPILSATGVQGPYAASQFFTVNFNSIAAKALLALNKGEIQILFRVKDLKPIHDGQPTTASTK